MDLARIPVFNEFLACDVASTTLSVSNATPYDANINYFGIKHSSHSTDGLVEIEAKLTFVTVVEFFGLQQATQCDQSVYEVIS